MSSETAHLAHHFDDADQQFAAARLGMWLFLATEVLFFGGLFAGYTQYRHWYPEAFEWGSHQLDIWLGTINTAVLLISSLTMALAVHATQTDDQPGIRKFLAYTIVLGSIFLLVKAYEYYDKYEHRLIPGPNFRLDSRHDSDTALHTESAANIPKPGHVELFFSFYFAMTGLHAAHMVIGVAILVVLYWSAQWGRFSAGYYTPVEMSGLYWHFVDIVWVFLFPLLYLIR